MEAVNDSTSRPLVINISGAIFEVNEDKLALFPQSLLGCPRKRQRYFDSQREEYFFDRHRQAFEGILFYYQNEGRLIYPDNVPSQVFEEEVKFFMLPVELDSCQKLENVLLGDVNRSRPQNVWQRTLWELFEFPSSSMAAKVLAILSQVIIVVSVAGSCLKTVDSLRPRHVVKQNSTSNRSAAERETERTIFQDDRWFSFDLVCYSWFTLECVVRLLASPNKSEYFKLLPNCVDFATIIIFYLELTIKMTWSSARTLVSLLETLSTIRILKIVRYSEAMRILVLTVASGTKDIGLLVTFGSTAVILGSSAVFFVELNEDDDSNFTSIPDTFWWAIITICTVGYGDKVPTTPMGKFLGAICAVLGTLAIALPLFRFAAHFRTRIERSSFVSIIRDPNKSKTQNLLRERNTHNTRQNIGTL
ncbi:potassium voltage-gated channel subfamily A member 2-like [Montipora foliosa]|uniref:potassium voltage-gated channel subfamily A member 2-like n=1 Tax=Montipora foliosa TaxID=591990 RepID=UPI0035F1BAC5